MGCCQSSSSSPTVPEEGEKTSSVSSSGRVVGLARSHSQDITAPMITTSGCDLSERDEEREDHQDIDGSSCMDLESNEMPGVIEADGKLSTRKPLIVRSSSFTPDTPPPSMFNKRDIDYPHKEQFDFLGLFYLKDVLSLFDCYKKIMLRECESSIDEMDLGEGLGVKDILLHQLRNSKASEFSKPVKIKSILKFFHLQDNKFLRAAFTVHCDDKRIEKDQITFKMFVFLLWNYCTQNANTFAEYAFELYDIVHSGAMTAMKFDRMIKEMYGEYYFKSRYAKKSNARIKKLGGGCVGQLMFKEFAKSNPRILEPLFKYQRILRKCVKIDDKRWEEMVDRRLLFVDARGRPLNIYEITQLMAKETGCSGDALHEKVFSSVKQYTDIFALNNRVEMEESDKHALKYCDDLVCKVEDVEFYDCTGGHSLSSANIEARRSKRESDPVIQRLKQIEPANLSLKQLKILVQEPKVLPAFSNMGFGLINTRYQEENELEKLKRFVQIIPYDKYGKRGYVHKRRNGKACCDNKVVKTKEQALALVLQNHRHTWKEEVLTYHTS